MKKNYIILLLAVLFSGIAIAQETQKSFINYQGVARNGAAQLMVNETMTIGIALKMGSSSGAAAYAENHSITTDANGVFSLKIGNGDAVSGAYNTIPWGSGATFISVLVNGTEVGTTEMMAVPYALSSGDGAQQADAVPYDNSISGLTATNAQQAIDELVGSGVVDADADPTNEIQDIYLTGNDLTISEGSTIDLSAIIPPGGTDDQNAAEVSFDNIASGLAATDAQGALDELATSGLVDTDDQDLSLFGTTLQISDGTGVDLSPIIPPGGTDDQNAAEVPFENTASGLAATDAQGAIDELATGGLVDTDDQDLSLSGTTLQISDGTGVDLSPIIPPGGTDDQNAAEVPFDNTASGLAATDAQAALDELATGGLVDTDDQALVLTGDILTIEDGVGSVDLSTYRDDADADPNNEIQTISFDPGTNEISLTDGGTITVPGGGGSSLTLPYFEEGSESGAAFHVHNTFVNGRFGLAGTVGAGAEILPSNNAGVIGKGVGGHGVYGFSETSSFAGVQGVSNSATGVGVLGYGFGGGKGGHFYTNSAGVAALTTGRGNVGIGINEPEMKMHVGGDLFVQTNLGELVLGFPNNGHQWQFSTRGQGADLQFQTKPDGTNSFTTRFRMRQGGEFQIGDFGAPTAWAHVRNNSTINKPLLKLEETGNDYARLELTNDAASGAYWQIAGLPSTTTASAKLNFYFRNASGAADRMTITGDGQVGVNTSNPSARLTINQAGQSVGTGLSFRDDTVNADWHVTHGFALRFHYGNTLRSFINANTGAYTVASDVRVKAKVKALPNVMGKVALLRPTTYHYKTDKSQTKTMGFIAQEVQKLFPELVSRSENDDILGINYSGFGVVAIRAIQEQQAIITAQTEKIAELEERLQRLEARFN